MRAEIFESARWQFGSFEIIGITDRMTPFPSQLTANRLFPTVSAEEWKMIEQRYPTSFCAPNLLMGRVSCYLIRQPGRTILVDTGMGAMNNSATSDALASGQLLASLQRAGITPDAIDTVFLTHLHPDHVGWNVQSTTEGSRPIFPKAQYIAPQIEWATCEQLLETNPVAAAHFSQQVQPLREWGILTLLETETELATGVQAIHSPGHSPGHMSLWIKASDKENILIAGDAFYHPLQVTEPMHHFGADGDAKVANMTRAQLLERFAHQSLILAACHFPAPGLGRVCYEGQARYWQPI